MKPILSAICFFLLPVAGLCQSSSIKAFPLSSVRLLNSPFKQAQQTDLKYMLSLTADRLLAPYLKEAGLTPKAKSYGNWENTGLDGHIGGHYLSALSNMYAATGNEAVRQRLNYMIDGLYQCQQKNGNGYVGGIPGGNKMWQEIAAGNIKADGFSLNEKWVPLYNIHKLYAGLVDAYRIAGNEKAKSMLIHLAQWFYTLTEQLTDEQLQTMLRSEHGGLNEAFADVAAISGDARYLKLAERLSHHVLLDPLMQDKDLLNGMHANTQIPKVIGFKRIAELNGDTSWAHAANFFWKTVTDNRTISIGGNSVREHFNPATNFSSMIESKEGPETCNTYNMLKLTKQLFLSNPSTSYLDYYESALYNHILSSQHPDGGFVYFTPIRPRHYRVYSQPQEDFWCCVGSGLENHGKYGELIYAHDHNNLYVNLFIPSVLQWKEMGMKVTQQTGFPESEQSKIKMTLRAAKYFKVYFRKPSWIKGNLKIKLNGKDVTFSEAGNGYVFIDRTWKNGDEIILQTPMETRAIFLPDHSPWFSFVRGPIVLAAATDTTDLVGLKADGSRMGHIANGPLYPIEDAPMIVKADSNFVYDLKSVPGKKFTFTSPDITGADKYKDLELVPFYTLHDVRYMLYWRYATPQQYKDIRQAMHEAEAAKLALEAMTIDQVAPGEQQPESDHNFKGEKTATGVHKDRHWRTADVWFSYDLKNTDRLANTLRVTYYGRDKDRAFSIWVNAHLVKEVTLDGSGGDQFFDVDYALTDNLVKTSDQLTVKFVAKEGSTAGGVYYLRLLK